MVKESGIYILGGFIMQYISVILQGISARWLTDFAKIGYYRPFLFDLPVIKVLQQSLSSIFNRI